MLAANTILVENHRRNAVSTRCNHNSTEPAKTHTPRNTLRLPKQSIHRRELLEKDMLLGI
jgi:hypothetical protein